MKTVLNALADFFGVIARGQTYLNALYLLLSFPLGLFYFIFLVVGLTVGLPLIIVWVGLLILAVVFAAWYGLIVFERQMAIGLLREDIPPVSRQDLSGMSLWQKFTAALGNPVTWKGLVYLLAKLPVGTFSFIVLVTLLSLSAGLIGTPFYYQGINPNINLTPNGVYYFQPNMIIDTLPGALIVCLVGIFVLLISLHIFNGLAWLSGKFARVMLGNCAAEPIAPAAIQPPAAPEAPAAAG